MADEGFKRKLTAILSADVIGYSRLMRDDEEATVRDIAAHRALISDIVKQHHGRVVDSPGDNILAEFASVVDAVNGAIKIQQEIKKRNADTPEARRMEFRIGINLGDVIEEQERIYGDGVNIAARVEGLADSGGIAISGTVYEHIKEKLSLGYHYLGEQDVKNISEPVRIYRLLTRPADAGKLIGEKQPKSKKLKWTASGALAIIIAVIAVFAIWNYYFRPSFEPASVEKMAFPLPEKPSIAVLPFANMSDDPGKEFLSDGITEQIITSLSKAPGLFVISRTSTFSYKDKPVKVQQVAEELGVRYVLEGSVQQSADKIRITAQLIDALTGRHIWAQRYERKYEDIFALQDEITLKILHELGVQLTEGERIRSHVKKTANLEAFEKLMEGVTYLRAFNVESNAKARRLAEEVIALDPEYTKGYELLALVTIMDVHLGSSKSPQESLAQATELLQKSLDIDETSSEPYSYLCHIYAMQRQFDKAVEVGQKAIELNPNSDAAYVWLSMPLRWMGKPEEAIEMNKKAIRLCPFPPAYYYLNLGNAYRAADRCEEAIIEYKKVLHLTPQNAPVFEGLTICYGLLGREEESRAAAAELIKLIPNYTTKSAKKKSLYKNRELVSRWYDIMQKAGIPENPPLPLPDKPSIAVLAFDNLSGDPEQEFFSDGISEEIINALSKTDQLLVIARNSSFTYKGKPVDVKKVSRELGVRYVLEGSVRKSEDRVRITAQLIDATSGHHLWSERYDRELKDIFELQDEITMKIVIALQIKLTEGEQARMWVKQYDSLDLFLKSLEVASLFRKGTKESIIRTGQIGQELVSMAPESSLGYKTLAWYYWFIATFGQAPKESMGKALKMAHKALSLDRSDADINALLATIFTWIRQYEKAIAAGQQSVTLNPNGARGHLNLGSALCYAGKIDEGIDQINQAIRLNPFPNFFYFYNLSRCYRQKGLYIEALAELKKALQRSPENIHNHMSVAAIYALLDRHEEAEAAANKVLEINPKFSVKRSSKTWPYKNQNDIKLFADALRKAGLPD